MKELVFLPDRDGRDEIGDADGFVRVGAAGNELALLAARLVSPAAEAARTATDDAAWRSALTLALLADAWTDCGTSLQALTIREETSPFASWVLQAQPEVRRGKPVHLLVLERGGQRRLLGMADAERGIVLPAWGPDLADVTPPQAAWYDRSSVAIADPVPFLSEGERALVLCRLEALALTAPAAWAYMDDLRNADSAEAEAVRGGDEAAMTRLAVRMEAVCGLQDFGAFTARKENCVPGENLLLRCLGKQAETGAPGEDYTYLWRGVPFARTSRQLGLTGVVNPDADVALEEIRQELSVMSSSSVRWNYETGRAIQKWLDDQKENTLLLPQARERIEASCAVMMDNGRKAQTVVTLTWPWTSSSGAVSALLKEALGEEWLSTAGNPFSDRLTLLAGHMLGDTALGTCCAGEGGVYLPPLSQQLAVKVAGGGAESGLALDAMRFRPMEDGSMEASFLLRGAGMVRMVRVYAPEECIALEAADAPTVAVWPCLPMGSWKAYYVFARGNADVMAWDGHGWKHVPFQQDAPANDGNGWRTLQVSEYPGCLTVMQDGLCLGALPNMLPPHQPEPQGNVVIGIDLGSSRTATAFAWDGVPTLLDGQQLTRVLSAPDDLAEDALLSSLQPGGVTPTAAVLTGAGDQLFTDGYAFRPASSQMLAEFDPAPLQGRLKWRCDDAAVRARKILLHQVMLNAALAAAAAGAQHAAWRVTIADDMGDEGREDMLAVMETLADQVAAETGLTPAAGLSAVEWAEESSALHACLHGEGSARGSCVSVDLGSGSTKLHLWLLNQGRPAVGEVVFEGVQDMLLRHYKRSPVRLLEDLADCGDERLLADVLALVDQLNPDLAGPRQSDKLHMMLDMLFETHGTAIGQHIVARNAANQPTYMQSILLEATAAALFCTGLMLAQAGDNTMISHLLPEDAPVFLTGRGAWLLDTLPPMSRNALQHLTHLPMRLDHPTRFITLRAAAKPAQSVALGLTVTRETGHVSEAPVIRTRESFSALMQRMLQQLCTNFPAQMWLLHQGIFDWQTGALTPAGEDSIRRAAASCYDAEESFATTVMAFLHALRENLIMPDSISDEDA